MNIAVANPAAENAGQTSSASREVVPAATKVSPKLNVVVVGAGPVGLRFAGEIINRARDGVDVTLFGDEPYAPYDRIKLTQLLASSINYDDMFSQLPEASYDRTLIAEDTVEKKAKSLSPDFIYRSRAVTAIDVVAKTVTVSGGNVYHYDKLVLAVGSKPHVPNLPGINLKGVYTFRNMRDAEALMARENRCRHVIVVGGGLLGLEVARGLKRSSTEVTLIHQSHRLMNRQLSDTPAAEFIKRVRQQKINVIVGDGLGEVLRDRRADAGQDNHASVSSRVAGIVTRSGRRIDCDTVVLCTGIKPNTELALNAGIRFSRGIVVDDQLQTSVPDVYAIGECCEHRNEIFGLVAPGLEQAAVLADVICGGASTYQGSYPYSQLKVMDELVNSMGTITDLPPRPKQQVLNYRHRKSGDCRSVAIHKGRLIGACAIGEWAESQRAREALITQRYVFPWQRLWFLLTGKLWFATQQQSAAAWPANAIVCQCNQLSKEKIDLCIGSGAQSIVAIGKQCGAGTVCGSCQPQLGEILAAQVGEAAANDGAVESGRGFKPGLLLFSLLAVVAGLVLWLAPAVEAPHSVQTFSLNFLWQDAFYKQVSGFSLLGVTLIGLVLSLRKRLGWKFLGSFSSWRLLHTVLGVVALSILLAHTGASMGENLNRYLMTNFLLAACVGGGLGAVIAVNKNSAASARMRKWGFWLHLITLWPLPILLTFHVISFYYF